MTKRDGGDMGPKKRTFRRATAAMVAVVSLASASCAVPPAASRDDQVNDLIGFVERSRGHEFIATPTVAFVPDAEFQQHVLASIEAEEANLAIDEVAFKALGWMPAQDNLFEKYQIAFGGAVVGFYDPATKVLEVRGTALTPYRREVVVHELVHALDDQLFDLNISMGSGVINEKQIAFLVAVEGDAARTQRAYVSTMSPFDQIANVAEQLSFEIDPEILSVPLALLSLSQAPYVRGPDFTSGLGGNAGIDAMFSRFPNTAEQAWNTAKYLANEPAVNVPTPPHAGTLVASGTWGQFLMTLVLNEGVSLDAALNPATRGWAGDAFVTWVDGDQRCIRIDTQSDDAQYATTLRNGLTTWSQSRASATIESVDTVTTRLTSCV